MFDEPDMADMSPPGTTTNLFLVEASPPAIIQTLPRRTFQRVRDSVATVFTFHSSRPELLVAAKYSSPRKGTKPVRVPGFELPARLMSSTITTAPSALTFQSSTPWAPWYVIPANDKDYRNWAVSKVRAGSPKYR